MMLNTLADLAVGPSLQYGSKKFALFMSSIAFAVVIANAVNAPTNIHLIVHPFMTYEQPSACPVYSSRMGKPFRVVFVRHQLFGKSCLETVDLIQDSSQISTHTVLRHFLELGMLTGTLASRPLIRTFSSS